jgi:hypothetical protein
MLPSPCGLRPQGRAATAPQWPLTCTIENQFVHKFFRISCKFHKYLDTILKNLEMFRNNPRLTVQHVANHRATSCKSIFGAPPPYKGVCLFSKLTSCSDRRHRRAAVRALSLQDRPGLQPIWPGSLAGWRSLGSDCLRRRARPASRAGRSSHGLGAPDVPT